MTQISPIRFPEAPRNGRALMRAIAEAEAEDHRAVNDDRDPPGSAVFVLLCVMAAAIAWGAAFLIVRGLLG